MSSARPPRPVGGNEEISDLIEVLRATDQRLDELLGGEVDTVTDRAGPGRPPARPQIPATPLRTLQAPGASQGLLDLVLLSEISGGDLVAQADILVEFRRANALDTAALRSAAARDDLQQVIQFSHRIKGSALMLGATLLAAVCARLEAASAANAPAEVLASMGAFETELLRLNRHLDTLTSIRPPAGR